MVSHGFPGGTHGWNYQQLIFAGFEAWAWIITFFCTLLWLFARFLVPKLPQKRCCKSKDGESDKRNMLQQGSGLYDVNDTDTDYNDDAGTDMYNQPLVPRETTKSKCARIASNIALVLTFGLTFSLYLLLSVASMNDSGWGVLFGVIFVPVIVLALILYFCPDSTFSKGLVYGLPATAVFYVSAAIIQFTIWDISPYPALIAFLAFIPLSITAIHYVTVAAAADIVKPWNRRADPRSVQCCGDISLKEYLKMIVHAAKSRPRTFFGVQVGLVLYSVMAVLCLTSGCLALYNTRLPAGTHAMPLFSFSTWLSRQSLGPACPHNDGKPCHVYLTMPYNISGEMLITAHTAVGVPDLSVVPDDGGEILMKRFSVSGLETNGQREVHSVLLSNLNPDSAYSFSIQYGSGESTKTYKFRTGPADMNPFNFTSGGDVGNTHESSRITSAAASQEPLFAMVGGDVAYGNGFRSCYLCWDLWLSDWEERMITPSGYSVPILINIGNHDAGTNTMDEAYKGKFPFSGDVPELPLIMYYFPSTVDGDIQAPNKRLPYHAHVVGSSSIMLSLDSGYLVPYGGTQADWIDSVFSESASYPVKMALYHVPIFPMDVNVVGSGDPNDRAVPDGFDYWIPLFDKHNVSIAFENHVHTYKRTYPLRGGTCQVPENETRCSESALGTVFLGDGYWGITQGMGFKYQDNIQYDPHHLVAKAGVRYHNWFIEVDGHSSLRASAIAGVPCPELHGEICDGVFDSAQVPIAPIA